MKPKHQIYLAIALCHFASFGMENYAMSEKTPMSNSMPERWTYASDHIQTLPTDDNWWAEFNDPVLDSLISLGERNNIDLSVAAHRISMSRAALNAAKSPFYPSLNINAGWTKNRTSGLNTTEKGIPMTADYFSIGADMSWQIDIFGKIAKNVSGKNADLKMTRADYAGTMVSICTEIASNYIQLRVSQAKMALMEQHIASQKRVLDIAKARYEASLASLLDVSQANTIYSSTKANLPMLHTAIATAINSLAILTGTYPEEIAPMLSQPAPMPPYLRIVSAGLPVDLLRRRPDIVAAEYSLASCAAALGVARKEFLPTLTLNGSIGTSAHNAGDLFSKNSFSYTIAPALSWIAFDGFARKAAVNQAKENMEMAAETYRLTVMTAIQETDNAMTSYMDALRYIESLDEVMTHANKSFELSIDLYTQGLSNFTNVADSQISMLQYATELISARGQALNSLINIYKALGGGWQGLQ